MEKEIIEEHVIEEALQTEPVNEEQQESEESDWSEMEEVEELRKRFAGLQIEEEEDENPKNYQNKDSSNNNNEIDTEELENDLQRRIRFGVENKIEDTVTKIGVLEAIVEGRLLVSSLNNLIIEETNVLMTKTKLCLGTIDELIGSIKKPSYLIKIDKYIRSLIEDGKLSQGNSIFVISSTMKIFYQAKIEELKKIKGIDNEIVNSKRYSTVGGDLSDQEVFSDDEQEARAKQLKKMKKVTRMKDSNKPNIQKRKFEKIDRVIDEVQNPPGSQQSGVGYNPGIPQMQPPVFYPGYHYSGMPMPQNFSLTIPENYKLMMDQINFMYQYPQDVEQRGNQGADPGGNSK